MSDLFDKTTDALGASINLRLLRQSITSSNIANAETPGYKAKKVDFEEALSRAIDVEGLRQMNSSSGEHFATGPGSISRVRADVYDNPDINVTNDGNTVDMEKEMATLAENSILYKAALQLINKKMAALKYAATEGSR
ncbi:MAG: flagellar basal body rod protein FlgB [Bdellovibrionaceae bacterium]|nr:flagellar basal body rod protein FlgB [Bdellovibrionales bacterium]MCB9086463.1 flagellar basal body rod protein FlgB [Pseudobdellovibrionaceae bacterium]